MRSRLYNIDTLKFLCAILVIFIHVSPTPYHKYFLPLTRCAVPCFFIISGFLIFSENKSKLEGHLIRSTKNTFNILLWSTALFVIVKLIFAFHSHDFSFLNIDSLINFILFNENPFGYHLWYISAYLYTLIIILFLNRKNKLKWVYPFIFVFLLLDLCLGKYSLLLWNKEFPYLLVRNFLCVGIPYFCIGMLIKRWEKVIQQMNLRKWAVGGIILFSITSFVEREMLLYYNINTTREHYISTTFLAISLFLLFLSIKQKSNFFSEIGEKDSLYIYILHPLFITFFNIINKHLTHEWQNIYLYWSPIIILIATILLSKSLRLSHIIK